MSGPRPDGVWLPLTAAQLGVYFLHQLRSGDPVCTTAELITLPAGVAADRLGAALGAAYAEHEQLRVRFRTGPSGPEQQMRDALPAVAVVEVVDRAAAEGWIQECLARPFVLEDGDVVRSAILCVGGRPRWWLQAAHHVVWDGYGFIGFAARVGEHYRDTARSRPGVRLADLVVEDSARRQSPELADDAAFWTERLVAAEGTSSLSGRTADAAAPVHRAAVELPPTVQRALLSAAAVHGVAWTDVATAAFAGYLGRLVPGDPDRVRLGLPFMDRFVPGGGARLTAKTICTAMNVLPIDLPAVVADPGIDVAALVAATATEVAAVREHVTARHEDLARELRHRRGSGTALFGPQVNLLPFTTTVDFGVGSGAVRNLTAGPVEDMTWTVRGAVGRGQPVWLEIAANPALYPAWQAYATAARLLRWLEIFATAAPDCPVAELPLLSDSEHRLVIEELNATDRPDLLAAATTLPAARAAQVARDSAAVALVDGETSWTYGELDAAADRLRAVLDRLGVPAGEPVGVALPRDARLFVAVHGVVAAGSPYVPLDPDQPQARLAELIADAGIRCVVTDAESSARLPPGVIPVDVDAVLADARPVAVGSRPGPGLDDPAYVIFTSGSTGRPKGVVVTHRAIHNRLAWMQERHPLRPGDRMLHKTPATFDVSVWELFWPLQVGATVIICGPGDHRDPRRLAELIMTKRVDTLHFVPSMLRALLDDPVSVARLGGSDRPVRRLFCSGEALPRDLVERAAEVFGTWPINLYGPTEAAVDVTGWLTGPGDDEVPIGRPLPNVRCYVLDRHRRPVPIGTVGQLHLAGVQLARGYANRPDLTEAAFLPDPFHAGQIMYATGDLARWRPDGALLYEGRADQQIKIAGQRVEPGEVESVLRTLPAVADVAVLAVTGPDGPRLAAYVVTATPPESARWRADLLARLGERLPAHLVPDIVVPLTALPLTASGKLDRAALAMITEAGPVAPAALPTSWLEEQIAATMTTVLGRPVGAGDDFFDVGGSSLLAVRLLGELEGLVGRQLQLADVFGHPSPRRMARALVTDNPVRVDDRAAVLTLRTGAAAGAPLITLPPAGGLGWCYAGLLRHLPTAQGVVALQAESFVDPGIGQPEDLDALAARQLALIRGVVGDGPFHLLGWSLGGMAAHAVAELAVRTGMEVQGVIMVDAYPGEQWRRLPEPTLADGLLALVRMGGVEHRLPAGASLDLASVQELLATDGSALASLPEEVREIVIGNALGAARLVRTSTHRRLDRDVTLVVAGAPRPETWLDPTGWTPHVGGLLDRVVLDGAHHQLLREPMIAELADLTTKIIVGWR